MRNEFLRVGQIVRTHGVRGDVKLVLLTDDPGRFHALKTAYLEQAGASYAPVDIENVRLQPDAVVLHIKGCDTVEKAQTLKNSFICVDRANAVKLEKNTYFIVDLIGCETFDTNGTAYGKVTDVLVTGANDVYEIEGGKLLVPALRRVLHEVDVENERITFEADVLKEVGCFAD